MKLGLLILAICSDIAYSELVLDLKGTWTTRSSNGSVVVPAVVPGGIYTDLMRANVIGDPYFRYNDVLYKWIGRDDWSYNRTFSVPSDMLNKTRVQLVCHGLDTVSEIAINGASVGSTDNMFVRYIFDIKSLLKANTNSIQVSFRSAVTVAKERHNRQVVNYLVPPTCPPPVQNGECHINYLRKIQSSFSWDWGPSFPSQGIWKDIAIEAFDSVILRDLTVSTRQQTLENAVHPTWLLDGGAHFERARPDVALFGRLRITLGNYTLLDINYTLPAGKNETSITFQLLQPQGFVPELWWPAGYGDQPLYDFTASFTDFISSEVTFKKVRIGFRTVELVQDPIANSTGLSFYARVNGVPIFAKGSNWIPADSFQERLTRDYIRLLLTSTRDANMNMLRVWGGGTYESEDFYSAADELGILIWQDLMFAVALYPVDDDFLASAALEVKQQVRRIQHHPSVFLWAGNNENEAGIVQGWWPAVSQNPQQYRNDYIKLYVTTLMPIVNAEDPDRTFLSSSPSNGLDTIAEGWISKDPQDEHYGDVHFYNYANDGWDWRIYPQPRFASEFGFQSYPSFESWANISLEEDWYYPRNNLVDHRQHHLFGDIEIGAQIKLHMKLPRAGQKQAFQDFIYMSQITQAMSQKTQSEHYRRGRSTLVAGKGLTMGALYWQLNDIWQAPSWSSTEFGGKWKMLHYYARNFFSPLLVSPYVDEDILKVYVISDLTSAQKELTMRVIVFKWNSFTPASVVEVRNYTQPSQSALEVYSSPLLGAEGLLAKANCQQDKKDCFIYTQLLNSNRMVVSSNFVVLTTFTDAVGLNKANIQVTNVTSQNGYSFELTLTSDAVAPYVWLDVPGIPGEFQDNGFLMVWSRAQLVFVSRDKTSVAQVQSKLTIKSLLDVLS